MLSTFFHILQSKSYSVLQSGCFGRAFSCCTSLDAYFKPKLKKITLPINRADTKPGYLYYL